MNEQRIHDELALRNLLSTMAQLADSEEDLSEYRTLFADDAVWEFHPSATPGDLPQEPAKISGRDNIVTGARARRAAGQQGPGTHTMHDISTIAIRFESESLAHSVAYWRLYGDTSTSPRVLGMGRYLDTFIRRDGEWQVLHRVVRSA